MRSRASAAAAVGLAGLALTAAATPVATAKHEKGGGSHPSGGRPSASASGGDHGRGRGGGNGRARHQSGPQRQAATGAAQAAPVQGHAGRAGRLAGTKKVKASNGAGNGAGRGAGRRNPSAAAATAPVAIPAGGSAPTLATTGAPTPAPPAVAPAATRSRAASRRSAARSRAGTVAAGASGAALALRAGGTGLVAPGALFGTVPAGGGAGGAHGAAVALPRPLARDTTDALPVAHTAARIVGVVPWPMWVLIGVLAAMTLALGTRSWVFDRHRRRLRKDVGLLQSALLPAVPAVMAGVATSAAYRPADGPGAGGDFYDLFELADGRLGVVVGDLSGHGRDVLPQTALTRYTLRAYLDAGLSPRAALRTASSVLSHQLEVAFATVAVAVYDPERRSLTYALAGHPAPFVIAEGADAPASAVASPPLGAALPTGMRQTTLALPGRATVCFFTDGLVEARRGGELFGEPRLRRVLDELPPDGGAEDVLLRVAEQTDARPDDMAACVLHFAGEAAPVARKEELEVDRRELAGNRPERFLLACGVAPGAVAGVLEDAGARVERAGAAVLSVGQAGGAATARVRPPDTEGLSPLEPVSPEERTLS
jgi:Stage II sporulation protein E (SpoIIE)